MNLYLTSIFLKSIQILIKNQESCIINEGITTQLFSLGRGGHQGYPISAVIFILALEVSFVLINSKNIIRSLDNYDHNFYIKHTQIIAASFLRTKNLL